MIPLLGKGLHMYMEKINTKAIISELHKAFYNFNRDLFNNELKEPAILIQSRGNKKNIKGWCSVSKIWKNNMDSEKDKYEINIVAEATSLGTIPVMGILLHEMVHLHNIQKEIKDTSRGMTYHNKLFRDNAISHGLLVEHDYRIGWGHTRPSQEVVNLIRSYRIKHSIFETYSRLSGENSVEEETRKSSSRKYICPKCGTIIRASKDVNIICEDCNEKFLLDEPIIINEDNKEKIVEDSLQKFYNICKTCGSISEDLKGKVCSECGSEFIEKVLIENTSN